MTDERHYYVYIMTNRSGTLYTGVTSDLKVRVYQHKKGMVEGFTKKYRINRLVYFEETPFISAALEREKEIKGWVRKKKIKLIESENPGWKDLSEEWFNGD
jgi:putative endonuclease